MPFKYDAEGKIVTQDVGGVHLPVFIQKDGKEAPFDGDSTVTTIGRLNYEAQGHRERADKAETKLKTYDGLEDPDAARKALQTVQNLDDKKLVDAGEVEKVKAEAIKSVRAEFEPVVAERDQFKKDLYSEKIGGAFARSKFIADKIAVPADMLQATFGSRFTIKDGKTVAVDANGHPIFSRTRHGEPADFEEALEIMVGDYAHKDSILKGTGASGSGAGGSGGGGQGGKRTVTRAQFDAMDPSSKATAAREAQIVD